ncbi:MAG: hypothetical protein H0U89_06900 [Acidimicrobiia bacterium]|nr:hypothetical protein [Acidimicrobiia bacterium]
MTSSERMAATLRRGAVAGVAGTAVMTAFQLLVEMPVTGRGESLAPANLASKLLPIQPDGPSGRRRLNYAAHFAVGIGWGVARGVAGRRGLRGQRAVAVVFGLLWTGDVLAMAALGLDDPPWRWSRRDLAIDVVDKIVLAEATGLAFEQLERS